MTTYTQAPVPSRARPYEKTQGPTPTWLRLFLGREMAPSREEYAAVTGALWEGDPAMDALVDWMFAYGPREARALFDQALNEGLGSIPDCPEPLRQFFKLVDKPPAWVDFKLLEDGARFIHGTGLAAPYVLRDLALMGGYLLSGFNQALVMTGALNKGTSQRVAETGKWWMDCTEINGLRRFGNGFKSTLHVRLVHALVRRNLGNKEEWDSSVWGLPLSQVDMVATYLGFSVVMLGGLRKLGIPVTPRESKAVMHLWSYACWIMGVDYRWLAFTESRGVLLLQHTLMTQSKPDWTTRELAQALSQEPLERHYDNFEELRRKLAYHQHLSVSQYFLGTEKMKQLGLPDDVKAWFPLATLAPRFATYTGQRLIPRLKKRQEERGRASQKATLASMFGDKTHDVIRPDSDHPAHV
ncbi:MAG: oxygenase MpaB family protein [Moraxellaceae bacterium]